MPFRSLAATRLVRAPLALAAFAVLAVLASAVPAAACGPDSDCMLPGGRTYRIALPQGAGGSVGAILFMHGYRGSAAGEMRNTALRKVADDLGLAFIAAKSGGEDWLIRNAPRKGFTDDSRELAYFDALLDDVTERFGIDPDRILAAGFSAGGMMTWTLACHRAGRFAGFLPIAGTFWAPIPETCHGPPADLLHIHGTGDTVVPLAGRPIADTRQGDVATVLTLFGAAGGFAPTPAADFAPPADLACKVEENPEGKRLALCLHDGGHKIAADWLRLGAETFLRPR